MSEPPHQPDLATRFRALLTSGALELPLPASGDTPTRLLALMRLAADDLELARVVEAHLDAVAILAEAGRTPHEGCLYGVWAAGGPGSQVTVTRQPELVLDGSKSFCSGAGIVDRALLDCRTDDAVVMFDIDARAPQLRYDASGWIANAFAATRTSRLQIDRLPVEPSDQVGPAGFYLDRVGFWHGACHPAACWAGGAVGLIDHAVGLAVDRRAGAHLDAEIGALTALRWQLVAMTEYVGTEIDRSPNDVNEAIGRARSYRHLVERAAARTLEHAGRALGPRSFAHDAFVIERSQQLQLYTLQDHAAADLAALGRVVRESG